MKKRILIIEGIIAAIAILAVVIVSLLPDPKKNGPVTADPSESQETSTAETRESTTEAPVSDISTESLTEAPTEPSTVPPTESSTEAPTAPPTEPPTAPPTEPTIQTEETTASPSVDYSKIIFVGDSRTKTMASGGRYEFRLVPDDCVSATWGGTLYDGNAQHDVTEAVFKRRPVMVFWYGINDVQMHPERDNVDIFIQNYDRLLSLTAENPGCTVYVLSILTTTIYEKDYYEGQNENIRRYNEALSAYC
ncbi:MAG: hypothetical protein J6Y95_03230, partial [Lachnospiraceae bacterium]|nr:hypothetical protein [Lachnospiraceae bacterium]